jgi:acyl dehydratase
MPLKNDAVGKGWGPVDFEVEAGRITQYADAIGAENPVHRDADAARAAGFRDLVAPPMFCVVYSAAALAPAILDPDVGMNFATMVHGGQEFVWGEPVCAGDVITTQPRLADVYEKGGRGFYVFQSESTNADGKVTARGTWTNIVRGA